MLAFPHRTGAVSVSVSLHVGSSAWCRGHYVASPSSSSSSSSHASMLAPAGCRRSASSLTASSSSPASTPARERGWEVRTGAYRRKGFASSGVSSSAEQVSLFGATAKRLARVQNTAKNLSDKAQLKERSNQILLDHLAEFVNENQEWLHGHFPTREYLSNAGRIDLAEAIRKLGGPSKLASLLGLKWNAANTPLRPGDEETKGDKKAQSDEVEILDRATLEKAIQERVAEGQAFMVEHTASKTPMRESEWTLWRAPMQDFEEIITAVDSCQRHIAGSYVRIINYNNKKVFYIVPPL
mmetsp:Transcript_1766/g.4553  ORF Transcript_1766/g.4553 Transcript_1766/m.4553 type:complete len:297 (-) Transcript_1766:89-979(-)